MSQAQGLFTGGQSSGLALELLSQPHGVSPQAMCRQGWEPSCVEEKHRLREIRAEAPRSWERPGGGRKEYRNGREGAKEWTPWPPKVMESTAAAHLGCEQDWEGENRPTGANGRWPRKARCGKSWELESWFSIRISFPAMKGQCESFFCSVWEEATVALNVHPGRRSQAPDKSCAVYYRPLAPGSYQSLEVGSSTMEMCCKISPFSLFNKTTKIPNCTIWWCNSTSMFFKECTGELKNLI